MKGSLWRYVTLRQLAACGVEGVVSGPAEVGRGKSLSFASQRQMLPLSQQGATSNSVQPRDLCLQQLFSVAVVVGNQEINRLCP